MVDHDQFGSPSIFSCARARLAQLQAPAMAASKCKTKLRPVYEPMGDAWNLPCPPGHNVTVATAGALGSQTLFTVGRLVGGRSVRV